VLLSVGDPGGLEMPLEESLTPSRPPPSRSRCDRGGAGLLQRPAGRGFPPGRHATARSGARPAWSTPIHLPDHRPDRPTGDPPPLAAFGRGTPLPQPEVGEDTPHTRDDLALMPMSGPS